jgi:hypothetical protein
LHLFGDALGKFSPVGDRRGSASGGFCRSDCPRDLQPLDYANGKEVVTRPISSFRNHVFRYSNKMVFILFENAGSCVFETVHFIFESIVPERIIVLGSIHAKNSSATFNRLKFSFCRAIKVISFGSQL